jgi:hypothetical protein
MHVDLLRTANKLTCVVDGNQRSKSDLRRAISAAYYAAFHFILNKCSEILVGGQQKSLSRARYEAYRGINHKDVLQACRRIKETGMDFPKGISDFAVVFFNLYEAREAADYDPGSDGDFVLPEVQTKIGEARIAIEGFDQSHVDDCRAFCALVALKERKKRQ